jgi:subtilisin family serine protease
LLSCVFLPAEGRGGTEKLDFELRSVLAGKGPPGGTSKALIDESERVHALIRVRESTQTIQDLGVELRTRAGDIYTAAIPLSSLGALTELEEVVRIEGSQTVVPALDQSVPRILADRVWQALVDLNGESITGKGVIVGVVDSGVDINHETFKNADGVSRIRWIWDMSDSSGDPPQGILCGDPPGSIPCGGTECTPDDLLGNGCIEIDDRHGGHGTHVLGIAAGRGTESGLYRGVAYDADLIVVKLGGWTTNELLEGVNYIFTRAGEEGKPAIVNLSLSAFRGPRDGSSLLEQYLDALTGPGRIIVAAAGNNGTDAYHSAVFLNPSQEDSEEILTTLFRIEDYDNTWMDGSSVHIEGWYSVGAGGEDADQVSIQLTSPANPAIPPYILPKPARIYPAPDGWLEFWDDPLVRDTASGGDGTITMDYSNRVFGEGGEVVARGFVIEIEGTNTTWPPLVDGLWSLQLKGRNLSESNLRVDLWIDPLRTISGNPPAFDSPEYYRTITPPSTAKQVIAVGSFSNKCEWEDLDGKGWEWTDRCAITPEGGLYNEFSGKGPRRDGIQKPDLIAPGQGVVSALSTDVVLPDYSLIVREEYQILSGTSMASPHVAGVVALMLQADRDLTPAEVEGFLRQASGSTWDAKWGWGRLDALESLQATMGVPPVPPARADEGDSGDDFCFIATAAFGDLHAPAVDLLRELRDQVLMRFALGRHLTEAYYDCSPPLARWLVVHPRWQLPVRCALRPAIGFAYLFSRLGCPQGMFLLLMSGMVFGGIALFQARRPQK